MRRLQLRQWLVLLLRTLAIILIVAAFARPAFQSGEGGGLLGNTTPTAALLLLDRSFSTAYRTPAGRVFDRLRDNLVASLELFSSADDVRIVQFDSRPVGLRKPDKKTEVVDMVNRLTVSQEPTRIDLALRFAERHFADARFADQTAWNRELLLFTDGARHNWSEVEPPGSLHGGEVDHQEDVDGGGRLQGVRVFINGEVGVDAERPNIFIESVHIERWMASAHRKLDFRVLVVNASSRELSDAPVDLYLDGERVQRRVLDLPSHSRVEVEFAVAPRRSGRLTGYVRVDTDALSLDNHRYFAIHVPEAIRILLVGPRSEDTYYARRALEAAARADPVLHLLSRSLDEMEPLLRDTDVVVLCNVERLSHDNNIALHSFVASGGGALIFPSSRADMSYYNRHLLPGLLPLSLQKVAGSQWIGTTASFESLDPTRPYHHPIFEGLWPSSQEERPRFWASFQVAADEPEGLETLVSYGDGRMALALGRTGNGRAVLSTVPLDLAWSDMPLRGLFAPLLHRLCRFLGQPAQQRESYAVGQAVRRDLARFTGDQALQAEAPSGRRLYIEADRRGGRLQWRIPRLDEAGIWQLIKDGEVVDRFPVNVDPRESDLAPVEDELIGRLFDPELFHLVRPDEDLGEAVLSRRFGRELWRQCLLAAVILLLAEVWIARAPPGADGEGAGVASYSSSTRSRKASNV